MLRFAQLKTLFHEFGHAMQGLVGSSLLAGFAETNAKVDFFEFPSQMFELWLDDPVIVRMISKHYQTGDPLSEDQISRLLRSEKSDIGDYTLHELAFSDLSLTLFLKEKPNIQQTYRKIMNYYCPYVVFDDQDHMPAGWGILADFIYGSKYYSYLWSKVYALDIYQVLKQEGVLNPRAGHHLIQTVLACYGCYDPLVLLREFLGRDPDDSAYLKYLNS